MRPSLLLLAPPLALLAGTGCVRPGHGARLATAYAIDTIDFAAMAGANPEREWTTADDSPHADEASSPAELRPIPPHLPASDADHRVERLTHFDLAGAYGALAKVDLSPCKALGLTAGYGRVILAFDQDGAPVGVGIDLPPGSAPAARMCIEQAFGAVRVAPFEGAPMKVRRAFFVKG
jgi:hypothetical protein